MACFVAPVSRPSVQDKHILGPEKSFGVYGDNEYNLAAVAEPDDDDEELRDSVLYSQTQISQAVSPYVKAHLSLMDASEQSGMMHRCQGDAYAETIARESTPQGLETRCASKGCK